MKDVRKRDMDSPFFTSKLFFRKRSTRKADRDRVRRAWYRNKEESFSLQVVGIALSGGNNKDISDIGNGSRGQELFFYGNGGTIGAGRQFCHTDDGAEVMVSGYTGFIVVRKNLAVP